MLTQWQKCAMWVGVLGMMAASAGAADKVPDLTQGGKPTSTLAGNLGPTGMLGWVHHNRPRTDASRQIYVTEVMAGSPAEGVMTVGDVILGANGTGEEPTKFTSDARRAFADAITEAEARNPATMKLLVWRHGKTATRTMTLEHMGAYSPTAPYDCAKSAKILRNAMAYLDQAKPKIDRFGLNTLALIACNDHSIPGHAERLARAREQIIELLPDQKHYESMVSDQVETSSKVAWSRTYTLIVLAEYYLATGENPSNGKYDLLTTIDAYAQTVARGQSMFGTTGHQFAMQGEDGSVHGPYGVGYGPINGTGLAALYGLTLARDCNLPDPETRAAIEAGIERGTRFFSSFVGQGTIPYGEHPAWTKGHASNGKAGLAAMALARAKGRTTEAKYFAQVSIAGATERHLSGHGGTFFNYIWSPLGANVGGVQAAAAHFRDIRWHLELSRMHDGGFYYNDYPNLGYHGTRVFRKASLQMYTPAILAYATPMKKLVMTGREWDGSLELTRDEVAAATFAGNYRPAGRTSAQLVDDLANFSATVRNQASAALAERPDAATFLPRLHEIAADSNHPAQRGVIGALGAIGNSDSVPVLIALFSNDDRQVRAAAAEAFTAMPREIQAKQVDKLLKMAAALRRPPMEVHDTDPMNSELTALITLLFDKNGIVGSGIGVVDKYSSREQLYEAIRAAATLPSGGHRNKLRFTFDQLSTEDVKAIAPTLMDLIYIEAPADAMFAEGIRSTAVKVLLDHRIEEGVHASIDLFQVGGRWTRVLMMREWTKLGRSVTAVKTDTDIRQLLEQYGDKNFQKDKESALKAIEDESKPTVKFTRLNLPKPRR